MSDPKTTPVARMQAEGRNPGDGGETGAPDSAALHPGYGEELTALPLSELVDLVVDKIAGQKPDDMPYVGLEHITKESPWLRGWGNSKDSISTNGVFRRGDILFGKLRPNLRKSVQAPFDGFSSTDILILRPKDGFDSRFVGKVFQLDHVFREAEKTSIGTGMPRTNWRAFKQLRVFTPCAEEQRRIAEILDTLDNAIQKTEQLIAKLKQIKQGLLHDLLTRGIDENGQLRDPIAHPEQFKDSVVGRIPLSWEVAAIGTVGDVVTGATPPSSAPDSWGELYPFVTPGEIHDGTISRAERSVSEKGLPFVRIIPAGTTLVVCIGSTLGKTAQTSEDCATNQQINAVIPHEIYDANYVYHAISAHIYQLFRIAGLQAVPIVNKSQFSGLLIPLAPPEEQSRIAQVVKVQDDRIQAEFTCLRKLNTMKEGLMHDLLTGKVRVTSISGASSK